MNEDISIVPLIVVLWVSSISDTKSNGGGISCVRFSMYSTEKKAKLPRCSRPWLKAGSLSHTPLEGRYS